MSKRNCPNCGAPYEIELNKCPYCNTSYYDLSALDFSTHEPFYLKIKTQINGSPCYITQLVRPCAEISMEMNSESTEYRDKWGSVIGMLELNRTLTTNISFEAVRTWHNNNLCTIQIEERS